MLYPPFKLPNWPPWPLGRYLKAGEPVVLIGDSGTRTTHLLIGLGAHTLETQMSNGEMTWLSSRKSRTLSGRTKTVAYWTATGLVVAELVLGGIGDVLRLPSLRESVIQLGYPTYFLVILGIWNMLGAAALLAPRFPRLKEWAYAGAFFVYSGAIVSHVITGKGMPEVWVLTALIVLTAESWALRPAERRLDRWS
jgi:uncharacterized membrane protein YphA (DoxX/SURF4 family)